MGKSDNTCVVVIRRPCNSTIVNYLFIYLFIIKLVHAVHNTNDDDDDDYDDDDDDDGE